MDDLASSYRWFAEHSAGEYAPLYREVTRSIADDPDLLDLVTRSPADAHHPGVLLAAVRYLLVDASNDPLAHCYRRRSINGVGEAFRSFALAHADELLLITRIRRVQTNELHARQSWPLCSVGCRPNEASQLLSSMLARVLG
jgi:hypothetical protein